jgi:hypothetical protein
MGPQLTLDDFARRVFMGKRTERLTMTSSEEFKRTLDIISDRFGETRSELLYRYAVEGMQRDLGKAFMLDLHGNKPMEKFFRG